MDYRKENWSHELECIRKAVNGFVDGYEIEITPHYTDYRKDQPDYEDRIWDDLDIAVGIMNGTIIEGYSSTENRQRKSSVHGFISPTRCILGTDVSGNWFIIVIGIVSSKFFRVVTCYPAEKRHFERYELLK